MDDLVEQARTEAASELRARLRSQLRAQSQEWLVEQLVEHVMERLGWPVVGGPATETDLPGKSTPVAHQARLIDLNEDRLAKLIVRYQGLHRDRLETDGYLVHPPAKGGALIDANQRTAAGEELLAEVKNLLYTLLFGEPADGVQLTRTERELLTLTVPRAKAGVFAFLSCAATEIGAEGTWEDPGGAADDNRAANTLVQEPPRIYTRRAVRSSPGCSTAPPSTSWVSMPLPASSMRTS